MKDMIISASRRTDIPAFYTEWFLNRIKEQFFVRVNPFNHRETVISLKPAEVDFIVFWTKNPAPLMKYLETLDRSGYRYYFQYTLNDYPAVFEPRLPPPAARVDTFKKLSALIGAGRVIWRYDPIILSNITPVEYHIERFSHLASELAGYTARVVISFLDIYAKVAPKLERLKDQHGVVVRDITLEENRSALLELVRNIGDIARAKGLAVYTCSEKIELDQFGIHHGACIDASLAQKVFGLSLTVPKDKGQRRECLCAQSVDMGMYNTCKFACTYCYANQSLGAVMNNAGRHKVKSPMLIGEPSTEIPAKPHTLSFLCPTQGPRAHGGET